MAADAEAGRAAAHRRPGPERPLPELRRQARVPVVAVEALVAGGAAGQERLAAERRRLQRQPGPHRISAWASAVPRACC